jgi:hypothetical protein
MDYKAFVALATVIAIIGGLVYYFTEIDPPPARPAAEKRVICQPLKGNTERMECWRQ